MAKSRESLIIPLNEGETPAEPRRRGRPKGSTNKNRVAKPYQPTGRPRGRPPSAAGPKVRVPSGRPRGRPKGSTKNSAERKTPAKPTTTTTTTTTTSGTGRGRGRPPKSSIVDGRAGAIDGPKFGGRERVSDAGTGAGPFAEMGMVGQMEDDDIDIDAEEADVDAEDAEDAEAADEEDKSDSE